MTCSQTGVNPEDLQAVRKARKKLKEKANGNHSTPLKICAKVSLCSLPGGLLCICTVSFVDGVNMQHAAVCVSRRGLCKSWKDWKTCSSGWRTRAGSAWTLGRFYGWCFSTSVALKGCDWQDKLSHVYVWNVDLSESDCLRPDPKIHRNDNMIYLVACLNSLHEESFSLVGSSTRSREWPMRFCPITTWRRSRGTASWRTDTASRTWRRPSLLSLCAPSTPSSWTGRPPASLIQWEPKPSNRCVFYFLLSPEDIFSIWFIITASVDVNALKFHSCAATVSSGMIVRRILMFRIWPQWVSHSVSAGHEGICSCGR